MANPIDVWLDEHLEDYLDEVQTTEDLVAACYQGVDLADLDDFKSDLAMNAMRSKIDRWIKGRHAVRQAVLSGQQAMFYMPTVLTVLAGDGYGHINARSATALHIRQDAAISNLNRRAVDIRDDEKQALVRIMDSLGVPDDTPATEVASMVQQAVARP